jgi:putative transposase
MKLTAKVKRKTAPEQFVALRTTLERAHDAGNWISRQAWEAKECSPYRLHTWVYGTARERFGLSSPITVRCLAKVSGAYKLDNNIQRTFPKHCALADDDRMLSWHRDKTSISMGSIAGRLKIGWAAGERPSVWLQRQAGESDLILHRGQFYLAATCKARTSRGRNGG